MTPTITADSTAARCFSTGLNQDPQTVFQFVTFGNETFSAPNPEKRPIQDPDTSTNPNTKRSRLHRERKKKEFLEAKQLLQKGDPVPDAVVDMFERKRQTDKKNADRKRMRRAAKRAEGPSSVALPLAENDSLGPIIAPLPSYPVDDHISAFVLPPGPSTSTNENPFKSHFYPAQSVGPSTSRNTIPDPLIDPSLLDVSYPSSPNFYPAQSVGPSTSRNTIPDPPFDSSILDVSYPSSRPFQSCETATDTQDVLTFAEKAVGTTSAHEERCSGDEIIDLTSFDGFHYPTESPTVTWPGSRFKTKLPFVADSEDPATNVLQADATHIESLAKTATLSSEWVTKIQYDHYANERDLASAIAEEMKWGRSVHLTGYTYTPASVSENDLNLRFNYVGDSHVHASDAVRRLTNHTHPHTLITLKDFCDGTRDNSRIQCVLDSPTLDGEVPPFVKFLDDGHTAYNRIHNYFPWRKHRSLDVQKSSSWVLIHQGLYHTYAHHDSDGYATWTQVLSGYKFWVILRPKSYDSDANRNQLYESADQYMQSTPKVDGFYGSESERTVIYAGPGDIIIMPPGTFHEVYTPVPSVTIGGHLYSYNALHLTELSRSLDRKTEEKFTNTSHSSTTLTVAVMLAALPLLKDKVIHKKPLAALCRMVQHPTAYSLPFQDTDFPVWKTWHKRSKQKNVDDVEFAIRIAKTLVEQLSLPQSVQHYPSKQPDRPDFIFEGKGFHDPMGKVEWKDRILDLPMPK